MTKLELTKIGDSTAVVLPQEMLAKLDPGEGRALYAIETAHGEFRLIARPLGFAERMERAEAIMARYPNTLTALA